MNKLKFLSLLPITIVLLVPILRADIVSEKEVRSKAIDIRARYSESIVHLSVVLQIQGSAGSKMFPVQEQKSRSNAIVVGDKGIVIAPLYQIDQSFKASGKQIRTKDGNFPLKLSVMGFKEATIILEDGREIRAEVVLKDEQLGILCLKANESSLEEEGVTLRGVDLSETADLGIMDYAVLLRRNGDDVNNALRSQLSIVEGMVEHPQKMALMTPHQSGSAYFGPDGNFFGVATRILYKNKPGTFIVLPADSIKKLLKQVKEAE